MKEHTQNMNYLLEAGVDFILIETMGSGKEAIAAAQVANELAPGHWGISFSVSSDTVGILRCGTPMSDIIDNFKAAAFIGINCMDGMTLTPQVKHLKSIVDEKMKIAAYGNIGFWVPPKEYKCGVKKDNGVEQDVLYVKCVKEWLEAGATIVGGCCGTTPETIRMINYII